jgi:Ni/Fe-hydrogenase 1 B-type cytochrome subunit
MQPVAKLTPLTDTRHPERPLGQTDALYVWQYPLRLFHWGMVISLCVLAFTGYYIHDPFIVGQAHHPFLMASFRFVHETFGMIFIALFVLRVYLFFKGNRWVRWRQYVPLRREQFQEMFRVAGFYAFLRPEPVSKIGHNALAACSYIGIYALMAVEIATGLVLYNQLAHDPFLTFLIGWISHIINIQTLRLIHFFLMYVFFAFGIFHVHLCMLISREEKRGLMDSIFIGYKVIPEAEIAEEERRALKSK